MYPQLAHANPLDQLTISNEVFYYSNPFFFLSVRYVLLPNGETVKQMGAASSVTTLYDVGAESGKPTDASDLADGAACRAEVTRLRTLLQRSAPPSSAALVGTPLEKLFAAVHGAVVADAASMPLHWTYDRAKFLEIVGDKEPVFFPAPSGTSPFYHDGTRPGEPTDKLYEASYMTWTWADACCEGHYGLGDQSPTGDSLVGMIPIVQKLPRDAEVDGSALALCLFEWISSYTGYKTHQQKEFAKNMTEGKTTFPEMAADNTQTECFVKGVLGAARFSSGANFDASAAGLNDDSLFAKQIKTLTHVSQYDDEMKGVGVSRFLARMLARIANAGDTIAAACDFALNLETNPAVIAAAKYATANVGMECYDFACKYGTETWSAEKIYLALGCMNPGAFAVSLHCALHATSFIAGVRENIMVGGDNADRAFFVGALLGAAFGVPDDLSSQVVDIDAKKTAIAALIA